MKKVAVAKSYANYKVDGEPFRESGKMYVNVIVAGKPKKVRWYTDAEYARMYPGEEVKHDVMDFNARHVFGFGADNTGYITIYRGSEEVLEGFVETHHESFRRNLTFGYYTPSKLTVPDVPTGIEPIRLNWIEVMAHDDRMKPHEEVQKIVAVKLGTLTNSEFQGMVGTWLEKALTIKENTTREDHFGEKHIHKMVDEAGNVYVWETSAKNFSAGSQINLRMKVKEHKEINGDKVTVVWYCKEI